MYPHVVIADSTGQRNNKRRGLSINRQKQVSQPPWAQLALGGRHGTETDEFPQRALEP